MKSSFTILLIIYVWSVAAQKTNRLVDYVNPLTGTANSATKTALKHGAGTEQLANTIPAVTMPFGMTQWTPQTRATETKCVAPYYYKDSLLSGFRGTHWLSGSCTQDYGSFTIMPITGRLKPANYEVSLDHTREKATPYAYRLHLPSYSLTTEITATKRCGFFQFTIEKEDSLYLLVWPNSDRGEGFIRVDRQRGEISGYNPVHRIYQGWGEPAGFNGYFVIQLEKRFWAGGVFMDQGFLSADSVVNKKKSGVYVGWKLEKGTVVRVKVGTSFTSIEGARKNLSSEIPGWNFDAVKQSAEEEWENALSQIRVQGKHEKEKRIFYTALYHSMQHPRLYNDVDGVYPKFSGSYQNLQLSKGNYYDDFSMWDIYRSQLPLFELLRPALVNDFVRSLILKGQQGGWMEIFPCWNSYTAAMIGDHATAFIASAYAKGIKDFDAGEAYRLMRKNAFETPASFEEYKSGKGRRALSSYLRHGYIPLEDSVKEAFHKMEQVSRTLEYAFDDYALSTMARALGRKEDEAKLKARAKNYQQVFDPKVGLMNGRYSNGNFYASFDADKKQFFITEGTPRQYSFYVPHDVKGLGRLMGGQKALEKALDSLFLKDEYWHGNEPGHQVPFMYNYTSAPWKTGKAVSQILSAEYEDGIGGLSGNDDAGQMSAWYVWAAMGLYPLNPASAEYVLTTPLFDRASIRLQNGKAFEIIKVNQTAASGYIQSVRLNNKAYSKNYIGHRDLMQGGKLEIFLGGKPSAWGTKETDQPSSVSNR